MKEHTKEQAADEMSAILRWMGAIVNERRIGEGGVLTVGDGASADLPVPGELGTGRGFALAAVSAGACEVRVPPGWSVKIFRGDNEEAGLARRGLSPFLLGAGERCMLSNWLFEIAIAMVRPRPSVRQGLARSIDRGFAGWLGLAAALMLVTVAAALLLVKEAPVTPESSIIRGITYINRVAKKPVPLDKVAEFKPKVIEATRKAPERAANTPKVASRPMTTDETRGYVKSKGLIKLITSGGGIPGIIFNPGLGSGVNAAITGMHGTVVGATSGMEGISGSRGGDGGPAALVGMGGNSPFDPARRARNVNVALEGKKKDDTVVTGGKLVLTEGLDKEVVGRIIRMHLNQAKFCYDRELSKNPNLYGKVTVQFTIGGTGKVEDAHIGETEMNSEAVESCLVRNVRSWNFPQPKGGGQVLVTYPFVFKPAGS